MQGLLIAFIPVIVLLAAGYAMARWLRFGSASLTVILAYAIIPPYLFHSLLGNLNSKSTLTVAGIAAAIALAGHFLIPMAPKLIKRNINSAAGLPNTLFFALPVLSIAWNLKSSTRMAIAVMFVTIALVITALQYREKSFNALRNEPWVFGLIAALIFQFGGFSSKWAVDALDPLIVAAPAIALVYVGGMLHPIGGFGRSDIWIAIGVRFLLGFLIAFIGIKLLSVPKFLHSTVIVAAMAPPATKALALANTSGSSGSRAGGDQQLISVGIIAALVLYLFYPKLAALF